MAAFDEPTIPPRKGPPGRRDKRKSQPSRLYDRAQASPRSSPLPTNSDIADDAVTTRAAQTAKGWRDWLDKQPTPQQRHPKPAVHAGALDVATVSTVKPHKTAFHDANPSDADVENDMIETGKEKAMQTAKHDKTIIDTDSTAKIDLRDAPSASVSPLKDAAKPSDDDIGSLFGPAIEDEVKGVRQQIRELIQCEMQGELGQRFSRNLRIVIRREIGAMPESW